MRERASLIEGAEGSQLERAATWLSIACAVHCLSMPLVLALLPLLGASSWQLGQSLEFALHALVIVSALLGSIWGHRRHHDWRFVGATILGLAAYLVGHVWEPHWYGVFTAVAGALVLAASAFFGARLRHEAVHHHHDATCTHS